MPTHPREGHLMRFPYAATSRPIWMGILLLFLVACPSSPVLDTSGAEDLDGDGQTLLEGDCNDRNPAIFSAAPEACDGLDNDCDTLIDENVTQTYYQDSDLDGFGAGSPRTGGCNLDADQSANDLDCDDTRTDVYPDAPETCDGVDNNCNGDIDKDTPDYQKSIYYEDFDGDGFGDEGQPVYDCALTPPVGASSIAGDCDDRNALTHPGVNESCDGIDNDCDGTIDEDFAVDGVISCEFCNGIDDDKNGIVDDGFDRDNDGYTSQEDCLECAGDLDSCGLDCDDQDPEVNPDANEVCDASDVDEDCNGFSDDADAGVIKEDADIWYVDRDQDAFGIVNSSGVAYRFCDPPDGYAEVAGDCNDSKASVNPAATEVVDDGIDQNCDSYELCYQDSDEDSYRPNAVDTLYSSTLDCQGPRAATGKQPTGDCDDTDPEIFPLADERCNEADDDCDGKEDEDAMDLSIVEVCNQKDDNCDGEVDEDAGEIWYKDADGDGYGDPGTQKQSCTAPTNYVGNSNDCDDATRTTFPGASERCNGVDDDCDKSIDESATDMTPWYQDLDGDGYGDPKKMVSACTAPSSIYVSNNFDCDDSNGSINPNSVEVCNSQDDDCDNKVDDGVTNLCGTCGAVPAETCNNIDDDCNGVPDDGVGETWYRDADGDGYGTTTKTVKSCTEVAGYVTAQGDCNDGNPQVNPLAVEKCNGIDDNCDNRIDDTTSVDVKLWYRDADGDGYGLDTSTSYACYQPSVSSAIGGDCNDNNATISPVGTEVCDSVDNDCDMSVDEDVTTTFYRDQDGDGYGTSATTTQACYVPSGYSSKSGDCNDTNNAIKPGGVETCNNDVDENCNGAADEDSVCKCTWELWADTLYMESTGEGKTSSDPAEMQLRLSIGGGEVRVPDSNTWYSMVSGETWYVNYFMDSGVLLYDTPSSLNISYSVCEVGGDGDNCDADTIGASFTCNGAYVFLENRSAPQSGITAWTGFYVATRRGL